MKNKRRGKFYILCILMALIFCMATPVTTQAACKHRYVCYKTQNATCRSAAKKYYRCSRCRRTYSTTVGKAKGHSWGRSRYYCNNTRAEKTTYWKKTCSRCGATQITNYKHHKHSYRYVDGKKSCRYCNQLWSNAVA